MIRALRALWIMDTCEDPASYRRAQDLLQFFCNFTSQLNPTWILCSVQWQRHSVYTTNLFSMTNRTKHINKTSKNHPVEYKSAAPGSQRNSSTTRALLHQSHHSPTGPAAYDKKTISLHETGSECFFLNLTESPCLKVHSSACDTNSALVWSQSSTRWQGIGWRFQRPDKSYHRASLLRNFPPSTFLKAIWADSMRISFSIQKYVLN